ncbi:hypothetical protein FCR2A7T_07050 [Flavobacterium cauense R2A-7]|uniref:hypothetical protein n=1 Tax=Flavobacterium cauense TaxID=510946 RepID=UPI0003C5F95E|nr:hypothetical protein [Flavobacterium cauense]ESU21152.1 hypothetical protein FCR2A7T_07050 [Flavobacterium cauense R2A-7]KGO78690.1 hypothetical protein Q762_14990 [Flavobacterium cauense R2A-7]
MGNPKIYKLSISKLAMRILFILMLLFLNLVMIYIAFNALQGFLNQNNKLGYIGIVITLLTLYTTYYFGTILVLFLQFYINEKGKCITIDSVNNELVIETKNENIIITEKDLMSIEFNLSNKNSKNLTSEYDFVRLNTISGENYVITNLIMRSQEFDQIFIKTKRIIKLNNLNLISKNCS